MGAEGPLAERGWKGGWGGLTVSEQGVWLLSISGEGKLEGFQVKMSRGVF